MNKQEAEQAASMMCYKFGLPAGPKVDDLIGRIESAIREAYRMGHMDCAASARDESAPTSGSYNLTPGKFNECGPRR